MFKNKKVIIFVCSLILSISLCFPVSAAGTTFDCSNMTSMWVVGQSKQFRRYKVADFTRAPEAWWYSPVEDIGDFEMHFPLSSEIQAGDVYTLSYDIYFGAGLNSTTQLVMPGLNENYIAANGTWEYIVGEAFFHWSGSVTVTAGYNRSVLAIVPHGLTNQVVCVNKLTVTIHDKDYTGTINNVAGNINNNADKNANEIKSNADKNANEIKSNADKNANEIKSNADKNANDIKANADKNASEVKQNQDKNTDKQIQADKDLYDKEHNETTEAGNSATDSTEEIPDKSEGFISALNNLVSAMTYTGTKCDWTFPSIKIPAIPNVIDETVLNNEMKIDFKFWMGKLPVAVQNILIGITSVSLVVYCFKELYTTISYVLTLKGGGDNE